MNCVQLANEGFPADFFFFFSVSGFIALSTLSFFSSSSSPHGQTQQCVSEQVSNERSAPVETSESKECDFLRLQSETLMGVNNPPLASYSSLE